MNKKTLDGALRVVTGKAEKINVVAVVAIGRVEEGEFKLCWWGIGLIDRWDEPKWIEQVLEEIGRKVTHDWQKLKDGDIWIAVKAKNLTDEAAIARIVKEELGL